MANQTQFKEPAPARLYQTILVDEEISQTFASPGFVMPNAGGRFIPYNGTSDPTNLDIRFAVEPAHNYPRIQAGASKLEVLNKHGISCEIEITMYNAGTLLTAANLTPGKVYGATLIGSGVTGNSLGKAVWTIDPAKTSGTTTLLKLTSVDLRGFTSTGVIPGGNTGGIGDFTARVLATIYR